MKTSQVSYYQSTKETVLRGLLSRERERVQNQIKIIQDLRRENEGLRRQLAERDGYDAED